MSSQFLQQETALRQMSSAGGNNDMYGNQQPMNDINPAIVQQQSQNVLAQLGLNRNLGVSSEPFCCARRRILRKDS